MRTAAWTIGIGALVLIGILVFQKPVDTVQPESFSATEQGEPTPQEQQPVSVITTKPGMKIETATEGSGPEIKVGQTAVVQYEGKLADGSVFDSTARRNNTPFEFTLGQNRVIQGWEQGVLGMKVGETRILTIPPELAYGPDGYPPIIPKNATLTFTVTLVGIK